MEGIGINLPLLVAFVINFVILFTLLGIFLYKPVLKMLDERQAKIKDSMEQAEQIKEQAAHSEEQIKAHLETARKEGQAIIAQATQIGERLKEEAKEGARQEFVDIAILAAEKVINETLDREKHRKLIGEVLEENTTFKQS